MPESAGDAFRYFYVLLLNMFGTTVVWMQGPPTTTSGPDDTISVRLVDEGTDWLGWVAALAGVLTLLLLAGSLVYARRSVDHARSTLEDARSTRHGQLILSINAQWMAPDVQTSREMYRTVGEAGIVDLVTRLFDVPSSARGTDLEQYLKLIAWPNLVETIGVLQSEGAITNEAVYKMWGAGIIDVWTAWDVAIVPLRRYNRGRDTYVHFETLAKAMMAIAAERRGT